MAEDNLLARLNALKTPTKAPKSAAPPTGPHPSIKPKDAKDDINARFRRLASGGSASYPRPQVRGADQGDLEDTVAPLPSERVENDEDEQSLDDLLKELGDSQSSWLNQGSEEDRVSSLLKEAKAALPQPRKDDEDDLQGDAHELVSETAEKGPHTEVETEERMV